MIPIPITDTPPKTWARSEIPTPEDISAWLGQVQAVRDMFPALPDMPELPPDMNKLTYQAANAIELVLLKARQAVSSMEKSWFDTGEIDAGGF